MRTSRRRFTFVPIKSDSEHYPPEGKLRVYRSKTGGTSGSADERAATERLVT
jgi:hypothetical protein